MKIMIVAPMWLPIPAKAYGGTERIVHQLTDALVARGHHVILSCHAQAKTRAQQLISFYPRPLREDGVEWSDLNFDMIQGAQSIKYAEDHGVDAVVFHSSWPHQLPFAAVSKVPSLYVLHGVWSSKDYAKRHDHSEVDVLNAFRDQNFISLSMAQRAQVPGLNYVANIPNGVNLSDHPFSPSGRGYAAWIGRFDVQKGPHLAIQIAKKAGISIKLAGPRRLEIPSEKAFWEEYIEPYLGKDVEWVGELGLEQKNQLLGGADVLINPYVYHEAFGLATLESLACGTPAVVPSWGGGPEIIEEGTSGYAGSSIDEWVSATKKAPKLDRAACRQRAADFTVDIMASRYEKAIERIKRSSINARTPQMEILASATYKYARNSNTRMPVVIESESKIINKKETYK